MEFLDPQLFPVGKKIITVAPLNSDKGKGLDSSKITFHATCFIH